MTLKYNFVELDSIDMKTLYNRLITLRKNAKSGVVGFCGDINNRAELSFMVYFHSLGYVFVNQGFKSSYFPVESESLLRKALKDFSKIARFKTAYELKQFEDECLESIFADLLWDMAHEMETENHTYETSDKWEIPCVLDGYDDFSSFTLGFAVELESDALGFFESSQDDTGFSVGGKDYLVVHDTDEKESWTVYHRYPEIFVDEQTGEEYMIQRLLRIISCDNWRSLYAASRAVIYNRRDIQRN